MHIYCFITTLQKALAGDDGRACGGCGGEEAYWPQATARCGTGGLGTVKWHISSSMEAINTSLTLDTYVHTSTYIHTYKNICPNRIQSVSKEQNLFLKHTKKGKTEEFSFQFCFEWNKINSAPLNFCTLGDFIQYTQGDFTPYAGGGGGWKEAEASRAQVFTVTCNIIGSGDTLHLYLFFKNNLKILIQWSLLKKSRVPCVVVFCRKG